MTKPRSFGTIPCIDLSLISDPKSERDLLLQLRYALTEVGFLYVKNHGVPPEIIAHLQSILPRLFELSPSAKAEVALSNSPHFLGYSGVGSETTQGKQDRREQFEFATELKATWSPGLPLSERLRGPNHWPSSLPALEPIVQRYISELSMLGERFLRIVARALELPDSTFMPFLSDQHRLKLVHYPSSHEGNIELQGVGPHKDSSGWWTFLLQASPPEVKGLQVLNRDGAWIDVPTVPGTFVVNIGQAFEVVTNGVCRATPHRVIGGSLERFSVPFFQGVRRNLTKSEALETLRAHFSQQGFSSTQAESVEARAIDSPFLKGRYDTWGECQLRTKIRSHRDVGKKFYGDVYDKYIND